ncbi:MAG TPA: hypothetical protein PLH75_06430 [Amaricoccus sp.]|uniref:hypothetical protein n=1 Tax=Amaricoccus sp. TaxID=1872485 RepID=UPI001D9742F7|nr:hypothetical protein [Amaricoccus sp.]MCB1374804.1 hypothetical protein [Paracoccaceae bacterium]MCB1403618.1 hypothetical protein [Paracoccaceae bacterium]HPG22408.1 hypothetical protein [Amaricoccus sp.]HRW16502.1 hypothetical protein [Amaricoccus sp.]
MSATAVPVADVAAKALTTAVLPPLTDAVAASSACSAAATAPPAPVLNTPAPSVSEPSRPTSIAVELAEQAPAAVELIGPMSGPSGQSDSVAIRGGDMHEGVRSDVAAAMAHDPAAGILHPLLVQGARELIALGHYPDLTALLNEAVYRLLESDYPGGRNCGSHVSGSPGRAMMAGAVAAGNLRRCGACRPISGAM